MTHIIDSCTLFLQIQLYFDIIFYFNFHSLSIQQFFTKVENIKQPMFDESQENSLPSKQEAHSSHDQIAEQPNTAKNLKVLKRSSREASRKASENIKKYIDHVNEIAKPAKTKAAERRQFDWNENEKKNNHRESTIFSHNKSISPFVRLILIEMMHMYANNVSNVDSYKQKSESVVISCYVVIVN